MEKIVAQGILYDFYGALLTEHQQKIYEAVVYDNMSLGEIAEEQGVSRQAVHDIVKRCDKILNDYENKLGLIDRFTTSKSYLKELSEEVKLLSGRQRSDDSNDVNDFSRVQELIEKLQDVL